MVSEDTKKELERIRELNRPQKEADFIASFKTLGYAIVALGFMFLVFYGYRYFKFEYDLSEAKASVDFKTVMGKITSSFVVVHTRRKSTPYYEPKVTYEYTVDGKNYTNDQIAFPNPLPILEEVADEYIHLYPGLKSVPVYYDQAKPQRSCLEKGITAELKNDAWFKIH